MQYSVMLLNFIIKKFKEYTEIENILDQAPGEKFLSQF